MQETFSRKNGKVVITRNHRLLGPHRITFTEKSFCGDKSASDWSAKDGAVGYVEKTGCTMENFLDGLIERWTKGKYENNPEKVVLEKIQTAPIRPLHPLEAMFTATTTGTRLKQESR